jgi:hypothetical protein
MILAHTYCVVCAHVCQPAKVNYLRTEYGYHEAELKSRAPVHSAAILILARFIVWSLFHLNDGKPPAGRARFFGPASLGGGQRLRDRDGD